MVFKNMKEFSENIGLAVREIKSAIVRAQSRVAANAISRRLQQENLILPSVTAKLEKEDPNGVICSPVVSKLGGKEVVWMIWPPAAAKLRRVNYCRH